MATHKLKTDFSLLKCAGVTCAATDQTACCDAKKSNGETCTAAADCTGGFCNGETGAKKCASAAAPGAPAVATVKITHTFAALDFSKLTTVLKTALKGKIVDGVLSNLPTGYTKNHIKVVLKAGSVVAETTITPLQGSTATELTETFTLTKQNAMTAAVVAQVKLVDSLGTALVTGKTMADLEAVATAPAVQAAATTTAKPSIEASSSTGSAPVNMLVAMMGFAAMRTVA
jgi:hypothetical protein